MKISLKEVSDALYDCRSDRDIINQEIIFSIFCKLFHFPPDYCVIFNSEKYAKIGYRTNFEPIYNHILEKYSERYIINIKWDILIITQDLIFLIDRCNNFITNDIEITTIRVFGSNIDTMIEELELKIDYIPYTKNYIQYVVRSINGFFTRELEIKDMNIDLNLNYNNDLPINTINNFINSDSGGIMIFHGIPGTGKSSLIRHIAYQNRNKSILFLDTSCFDYITDASFIEMLLNYKNSIVVLEDCETLLQDRSSGNYKLANLLNISDGILGDSLNIKFICTFNSDLTTIDKAILRKGRLKLKYEFKKLTSDKVKTLGKELGKNLPNQEMTLCDIYNFEEDNGGTKQTRKIGF